MRIITLPDGRQYLKSSRLEYFITDPRFYPMWRKVFHVWIPLKKRLIAKGIIKKKLFSPNISMSVEQYLNEFPKN